MKKKVIIVFCAVALSLIGVIIVMLFANKTPKIKNFDIVDYSYYISEFSSNEVLGKIDNAEIAKEKAESIWWGTYGESIKNEKPYQVFFDATNEVWLVSGTMPRNQKGGVANILIQKSDGKVLAVWHDK